MSYRTYSEFYTYKTLPSSTAFIIVDYPCPDERKRIDPGLGVSYYTTSRNFVELFYRTLIHEPNLIIALWNREYDT